MDPQPEVGGQRAHCYVSPSLYFACISLGISQSHGDGQAMCTGQDRALLGHLNTPKTPLTPLTMLLRRFSQNIWKFPEEENYSLQGHAEGCKGRQERGLG